jgi:hypothetical protein
MAGIPLDKFNLNRFWEKTPTPLKYILIFVLFAATAYFIFAKRMNESQTKEIETMKVGIVATYKLIDNFEDFRQQQDEYNKEVLTYLQNLHKLVEELNETQNRKFDMILKSGSKNSDAIVDKIMLLNESFEKISKVYQETNIKAPDLEKNKTTIEYSIEAIPLRDTGLLKK